MNTIQFQLRPRCKKEEKKVAVVERGKLPRIAEVLALAIQFDDMIRRGVARDHADLARLGCISKERISQIMRLVWLAPDIQQEILTLPRTPRGRFPIRQACRRLLQGPRHHRRRQDRRPEVLTQKEQSNHETVCN